MVRALEERNRREVLTFEMGSVEKLTFVSGSDKGKFNLSYSIIICSDESFNQPKTPS